MPKYALTKETQNLILDDQELQGKIAKELDRSVPSVIRYARDNEPILTMASVLQIIAVHTGEDKTIKFLQELQVSA